MPLVESPERFIPTAAPGNGGGANTPFRVLVVDDDPLFRATARSSLSDLGLVLVEPTHLGTPPWWPGILDFARPDLVVLDVDLGQPTDNENSWRWRGDEIARRHRERDFLLYLHSGMPRGDLARLAANSAADGWIAKDEDLRERVREALKIG